MSKPRAIPLAAQVEAAVERAEAAEAKAARLKQQVGELTRAQQATSARLAAAQDRIQWLLDQQNVALQARAERLSGYANSFGKVPAEPPKAAPPPTCMLYGEPATIKSTFELYLRADAVRNAVEKALAECRDQLRAAQRDLENERLFKHRANDEVASLRRALAETQDLLPKAVTAPSRRAPPLTMGEAFCLLAGLGMGVAAGGMLL